MTFSLENISPLRIGIAFAAVAACYVFAPELAQAAIGFGEIGPWNKSGDSPSAVIAVRALSIQDLPDSSSYLPLHIELQDRGAFRQGRPLRQSSSKALGDPSQSTVSQIASHEMLPRPQARQRGTSS